MTDRRPLAELVAPDWAQALAPVQPRIEQLGDWLRAEVAAGRPYLPAGPNVLRAFSTPLADVRVLVLGQDPYPTPGHAIGLSFAVERSVRPPLTLAPGEQEPLRVMLRAGFSAPRKQLHNVLPGALGFPADVLAPALAEAGIEPSLRAQHLALTDWERLMRVLLARHPRALGVD